jgi:cell division protein FtsQ
MGNTKYNTKKILRSIIWMLIGIVCITLLISAVHNKEAKICKAVEIEISGVNNNFFIDKNDVYAIIKNFGGDSTQQRALEDIDLKQIERELEKNVWIKNAELFFDNNNVLKVSVNEREPVARLFTNAGNSFYIDSSCKMLPLSDKFSARLPIFTGFIADEKYVSPADSLFLLDIKNISTKIMTDSFLMAMIEQVDVTANHNFEMIPKIGKQKIIFGDATDVDLKFAKLKMFYKTIIAQAGWNRYNSIDLQYKNQVVASVRGATDVAEDSLRTLQLMQSIVENATRQSADSAQIFMADIEKNNVDSAMIEQSVEREDEGISPVVTQFVITKLEPAVVKPTATTPVATKPAAVQPLSIPIKPAIKNVPIKKPTVGKPPIGKPPTKKPAAIAVTPRVTAVVAKPKPKMKPAITMPAKPVIKKPVLQQKPKSVVKKPANDY